MGDDERPPRKGAPHLCCQPLFRGLPSVVWVLSGFFVATMLMWSIVKIPYGQPDERAHVSAVIYWSEFRDWPAAGDMKLTLSTMRSAERVGDPQTTEPVARSDRPSFEDMTGENLLSSTSTNQMAQHPPLYYMGLAVVHDGLQATGISSEAEVWFFRLVSILLTAALPLLSAALARRLGGSRPVVVLAAALTATFPGLALVGAAVNNDNLLNIASGWAILGMGVVLAGDLRRRTAVWIGLALAVALFTKAFAMPVAFGVGVAYLVSIRRTRNVRDGFASLALTILVAALGGWWWLWNLRRYGTIQPAGIEETPPAEPLSAAEALRIWSDRYLEVFFTRFWLMSGSAGKPSLILWLSIAATVVGVVALVAGLVALYRRKRRSAVDSMVILVPFALALAIVLASTFRIAVRDALAAGVQGRYLYSGLVGAIGAWVLGFGHLVSGQRQRLIASALGLVGILVSLWRMFFEFRRRWASDSSVTTGLGEMFDWAPIPNALSVLIVVTFAVATLLSIIMLVRETGARVAPSSSSSLEPSRPRPTDRADGPVERSGALNRN